MIPLKTPYEIETIAEGGKILARIMKELEKAVKPGITTKTLDRLAESLIFKFGAKPSFKGYDGFPACLCASLNEEIVHAIPSKRLLKDGDLLSLDLGILYKGFHSDMAHSLVVGKGNQLVKKLIAVTKKSLELGIKEVKKGNHLGDIGFVIQKYVEANGFNVIRDLCGHGIGRKLHEDPQVLNYLPSGMQEGKRETGPELNEGMVICLEPMVTAGNWHIKKAKDGFGFETIDGSLSCHFEDMVAITKNGVMVLTKS